MELFSNYEMPDFRDENGVVWRWDSSSHDYVAAGGTGDLEDKVDIGHASGGDNDLFRPDSSPSGEGNLFQTKNPLQEGIYAHSVKTASVDWLPQRTDITEHELLLAVANLGWSLDNRGDHYAITTPDGDYGWVDINSEGIFCGLSFWGGGVGRMDQIVWGLEQELGPLVSEHDEGYYEHPWMRDLEDEDPPEQGDPPGGPDKTAARRIEVADLLNLEHGHQSNIKTADSAVMQTMPDLNYVLDYNPEDETGGDWYARIWSPNFDASKHKTQVDGKPTKGPIWSEMYGTWEQCREHIRTAWTWEEVLAALAAATPEEPFEFVWRWEDIAPDTQKAFATAQDMWPTVASIDPMGKISKLAGDIYRYGDELVGNLSYLVHPESGEVWMGQPGEHHVHVWERQTGEPIYDNVSHEYIGGPDHPFFGYPQGNIGFTLAGGKPYMQTGWDELVMPYGGVADKRIEPTKEQLEEQGNLAMLHWMNSSGIRDAQDVDDKWEDSRFGRLASDDEPGEFAFPAAWVYGSSIDEAEARQIASEWHGGQGSALYAFASSGTVYDGLDSEIRSLLRQAEQRQVGTPADIEHLRLLLEFIEGPDPDSELERLARLAVEVAEPPTSPVTYPQMPDLNYVLDYNPEDVVDAGWYAQVTGAHAGETDQWPDRKWYGPGRCEQCYCPNLTWEQAREWFYKTPPNTTWAGSSPELTAALTAATPGQPFEFVFPRTPDYVAVINKMDKTSKLANWEDEPGDTFPPKEWGQETYNPLPQGLDYEELAWQAVKLFHSLTGYLNAGDRLSDAVGEIMDEVAPNLSDEHGEYLSDQIYDAISRLYPTLLDDEEEGGYLGRLKLAEVSIPQSVPETVLPEDWPVLDYEPEHNTQNEWQGIEYDIGGFTGTRGVIDQSDPGSWQQARDWLLSLISEINRDVGGDWPELLEMQSQLESLPQDKPWSYEYADAELVYVLDVTSNLGRYSKLANLHPDNQQWDLLEPGQSIEIEHDEGDGPTGVLIGAVVQEQQNGEWIALDADGREIMLSKSGKAEVYDGWSQLWQLIGWWQLEGWPEAHGRSARLAEVAIPTQAPQTQLPDFESWPILEQEPEQGGWVSGYHSDREDYLSLAGSWRSAQEWLLQFYLKLQKDWPPETLVHRVYHEIIVAIQAAPPEQEWQHSDAEISVGRLGSNEPGIRFIRKEDKTSKLTEGHQSNAYRGALGLTELQPSSKGTENPQALLPDGEGQFLSMFDNYSSFSSKFTASHSGALQPPQEPSPEVLGLALSCPTCDSNDTKVEYQTGMSLCLNCGQRFNPDDLGRANWTFPGEWKTAALGDLKCPHCDSAQVGQINWTPELGWLDSLYYKCLACGQQFDPDRSSPDGAAEARGRLTSQKMGPIGNSQHILGSEYILPCVPWVLGSSSGSSDEEAGPPEERGGAPWNELLPQHYDHFPWINGFPLAEIEPALQNAPEDYLDIAIGPGPDRRKTAGPIEEPGSSSGKTMQLGLVSSQGIGQRPDEASPGHCERLTVVTGPVEHGSHLGLGAEGVLASLDHTVGLDQVTLGTRDPVLSNSPDVFVSPEAHLPAEVDIERVGVEYEIPVIGVAPPGARDLGVGAERLGALSDHLEYDPVGILGVSPNRVLESLAQSVPVSSQAHLLDSDTAAVQPLDIRSTEGTRTDTPVDLNGGAGGAELTRQSHYLDWTVLVEPEAATDSHLSDSTTEWTLATVASPLALALPPMTANSAQESTEVVIHQSGDVPFDPEHRFILAQPAVTEQPQTQQMPDLNYVLDYNPENMEEAGWFGCYWHTSDELRPPGHSKDTVRNVGWEAARDYLLTGEGAQNGFVPSRKGFLVPEEQLALYNATPNQPFWYQKEGSNVAAVIDREPSRTAKLAVELAESPTQTQMPDLNFVLDYNPEDTPQDAWDAYVEVKGAPTPINPKDLLQNAIWQECREFHMKDANDWLETLNSKEFDTDMWRYLHEQNSSLVESLQSATPDKPWEWRPAGPASKHWHNVVNKNWWATSQPDNPGATWVIEPTGSRKFSKLADINPDEWEFRNRMLKPEDLRNNPEAGGVWMTCPFCGGQNIGTATWNMPHCRDCGKYFDQDKENLWAGELHGTKFPETWQRRSKEEVEVAGICVTAEDTGRILMLQRDFDDTDDPARGKWEFPGGHLEDEAPLDGAKREWEEETGIKLPEGVAYDNTISGIYQLFFYKVPSEDSLEINPDPDSRKVDNPDDPDGDITETVAWWLPEDAKKNPALREECKKTDWSKISRSRLASSSLTSLAAPESVGLLSTRLTQLVGAVKLAMPYSDNTWYHVTDRSRLPQIQQQGLVGSEQGTPRVWGEYPVEESAVYLHPNVGAAWSYAQSYGPTPRRQEPSAAERWQDPVILRIKDLDYDHIAPDHESISNLMENLGYNEDDPEDPLNEVVAWVEQYEHSDPMHNSPEFGGEGNQNPAFRYYIKMLREMPSEYRQLLAELAGEHAETNMHYGPIHPHQIEVGHAIQGGDSWEDSYDQWREQTGHSEYSEEDIDNGRDMADFDQWLETQPYLDEEALRNLEQHYEDPTDDSMTHRFQWTPIQQWGGSEGIDQSFERDSRLKPLGEEFPLEGGDSLLSLFASREAGAVFASGDREEQNAHPDDGEYEHQVDVHSLWNIPQERISSQVFDDPNEQLIYSDGYKYGQTSGAGAAMHLLDGASQEVLNEYWGRIERGDNPIWEIIEPYPLSGEWADSPNIDEITGRLLGYEIRENYDVDDLIQVWEEGYWGGAKNEFEQQLAAAMGKMDRPGDTFIPDTW